MFGSTVSGVASCRICRWGFCVGLRRFLKLWIVTIGVVSVVCSSGPLSAQNLSMPQSATFGFRTC
jgi:hypothetical protein